MISKKIELSQKKSSKKGHACTYSTNFFKKPISKYQLGKKSIPANVAYQLVHDEINIDPNPSLNLAGFVTTWMEPEVISLINENLHKNFIDHDEYPQTEIIHRRCVNMIARLFNSPKNCTSIGTATVGSSEAITLALLGHKWKWKQRRIRENKPFDKPNIIIGADFHVCWDKFAKYFDVEIKKIPLEKNCFTITAEKVERLLDENTICVGGIVGTTYTGQSDPIKEINDMLLKVKKTKGWDIPLHVDAASGGFVLPFTDPDFVWDFRLEQVKSINVSGHKYGLVYTGIGWVVWRDEADFPKELIFNVNYLGGSIPTYTLNFSRDSSTIIAQYYNFLRLGKEGYSLIMNNCLENARYIARRLEGSGRFVMISCGEMLPIVSMRLKDNIKDYDVFDISEKLQEYGWTISAYSLPEEANISIMRIVVREHVGRDLLDIFYDELLKVCRFFENKK